MSQRLIGSVLAASVLAVFAFPVSAAPASPAKTESITAKTAASAPAATSPLKDSENQLKLMGESIHRVKTAAVDLVRECSRENEVMGGEIDFVGTDVIPILPDTAEGFGGAQYLPPRPKYINLHMSQLAMLLPILQDDVMGLKAPDVDEKEKTQGYVDEMKSLIGDVQKQYQRLQTLTSTPPYDAQSIIGAARDLHGTVSNIDKLRKDVYKSFKHDPDKGEGK
jgi:hypothetical protein